MHSLRGLAIFGVLLAPAIEFIGTGAWFVFVVGYASHLLADMMNPSGIPVTLPSEQTLALLPPPLRIATGSPEEDLVFVVFACLILTLFLR